MLAVEGIERVSGSKSAHVSWGWDIENVSGSKFARVCREGDRKGCQAVNLPMLAGDGVSQ